MESVERTPKAEAVFPSETLAYNYQMTTISEDVCNFENHCATLLLDSKSETNIQHEIWQPCTQKGDAPFSFVSVKVVSSSPQSLTEQSSYPIR
jgi:hypothetical protein